MIRQHRHRDIELVVGERERLGMRRQARRSAHRALRPHRRRRFHRNHLSVGRLIRAGSGSYVQDRLGVPQRLPDTSSDTRIRATLTAVCAPDLLVELTSCLNVRCHARRIAHTDPTYKQTAAPTNFQQRTRLRVPDRCIGNEQGRASGPARDRYRVKAVARKAGVRIRSPAEVHFDRHERAQTRSALADVAESTVGARACDFVPRTQQF
jgi:hypothetical protein